MEENRRKGVSVKVRNNILGWGFVLPLIIYFLVFQLAPIILSFFYSLTDWDGFSTSYAIVGFKNYIEILTDSAKYPDFWKSIGTTFLYALLTVPASVILALVVAAILNSHIKGERFFKTCFYIPSVTAGVAVSAVWIFLLDPSYGVIGWINKTFNASIDLLHSTSTALPTLAVMSIWGGLGYNVLIMLSAMKNINPQLYEACDVDGGGTFKKFFSVTVPGVFPTLFFLMTTSLIGSLQAFDQMYLMTGGQFGTSTIMFEVYRRYMDYGQINIASSMSYILFLFIAALMVVQFKVVPQDTNSMKWGGGKNDARKLMHEIQAEKAN